MLKMRNTVFLLLFLLAGFSAHAAKRYWVAATASAWNSTANWSSSSGGAGGSSVPTSSDTAYFDGNGTGNDTLDVNVSVKRLEIAAGYTGTIVQGAYTVTIGTSGAVLSGGTFAGGSGSITASGAFTISGCAFTSTSGTLTLSGNYTLSSGSFTHNSGKVKCTATNTITGTSTFNKLEFAPATTSTYTIASGTTLTVGDTLLISGSSAATFNTGTINAGGNISITSTSNSGGGTASLVINGTGTQTFTGGTANVVGRVPHVTINKASGTLYLVNTIAVTGNWTYTAGTINEGTSHIHFIGTKTISGTHTLYGVTFSGSSTSTYTITTGDTVKLNGTLSIGGTAAVTLTGGTIHAKGNITINNTSNLGGGSTSIVINGTADQTFTGGTVNVVGRVPHITINKASGTLYLVNTIAVTGHWTYTNGTIDAGTSMIHFIGTKTISGTHTLYSVNFSGGATSTYTIGTGYTLTLLGGLSAGSSSAIKLDSGTIHAKGNITINNTSTSTGGTATIVINGTGSQSITGSGTAGQGSLPNVTIDKSSGTLTLNSIISVAGNWTYTQGTVDPTTSSVAFYGTANLDGQGTSATMPFYTVAIGANTTTLTGNLDVNNNLVIAAGTTLSAGSYTINVGNTWNSQGTWTYATSTVIFDGTGYKSITGASSVVIQFYNVTFNRTSGSTTLVRAIKVNNTLTLTKGKIIASSTNYVELVDNATCTGASDSSYVHGPVRKTGNDAFIFPVGDTTVTTPYHPLTMTAPSVTTDQFETTYKASTQIYGSTLGTGLGSLSTCQHWLVDRKAGTSTPTVSLSWNSNCNNSAYSEMRVAEWTGVQWADLGQASVTVSAPRGTVAASSAMTFTANPSVLTIGFASVNKSYALIGKSVDGGYYSTDGKVLYFGFDEEYKDADGELTYTVTNLSTDRTVTLAGSQANAALVSYGNNQYKIDLYDNTNTALASGYYLLEVTNEKNEKWYLRFKI